MPRRDTTYVLDIVATPDGDQPMEERCLTATVATSTPPLSSQRSQRHSHGARHDNRVPGRGPNDGDRFRKAMDLMTVYPCIGSATSTYPCRGTEGLETGDGRARRTPNRRCPSHRRYARYPNVRYGEAILRPEKVIIQTKFPFGFHTDDDTWRTGQTNGVVHSIDTTRLPAADWTPLTSGKLLLYSSLTEVTSAIGPASQDSRSQLCEYQGQAAAFLTQ